MTFFLLLCTLRQAGNDCLCVIGISGVPKVSATKRLGVRGPTFNMSPHHSPQLHHIDNQNNMAAVNPFSDNVAPQNSFPHPGMGQVWQQGGQQQWMGAQHSPRQQVPPGFPQRPHMEMHRMPTSPYGFHSNQGRMGPRFPQAPGGAGGQPMYTPHHQVPSPRSPGRAQISPMQGQMSPIQSQMSPGSYQGQGSMTPRSHGSPYSHPQSPEFVATPLHKGPPQSSQLGIGNMPASTPDHYQRSQVHQKIQSLINAKRLSPGHGLGMDLTNPEGYLSIRLNPQSMIDRTQVQDNRQSYGSNQPISVMSTLEASSRDPFSQGISCSGNTPFSPTDSSALSTCAQRQSAIQSPSGQEPKGGQFNNTRGYLIKHLEALKSQRSPAAISNNPSNSSMFTDHSSHQQQRSPYGRQSSVPVQSRDFNASGGLDSPDGADISPRRIPTSALGNMQIPKPNLAIPQGPMNPAMASNLQSSLQGPNPAQNVAMSNSLAQHYSQQGLHVNIGSSMPPSGSNSMSRPEPVSKTSQVGLSAQYEQISPPITPLVSPSSVKRSGPSTPSPSNNPTHLSPLQKLLLDPMPPATPENESKSHSNKNSRSGSSSTSLDQQRNSPFRLPLDQGTFSPPATQRKGFENSKLYNLLSGEKQKNAAKTPSSDNTKSPASTPSLNDSQQDIFAEIESASQNSGALNSQSDMDDSLLSLFSDDFKVKPLTDESDVQPTARPEAGQSFNSGNISRETTSSETGTLSGLQSFVSSVRKGPEFGVDFSKRKENQAMERHQFVSQMSNSSVGSLDSSLGSNISGTPQQNFQQQQQQQQQPSLMSHQPNFLQSELRFRNSSQHFGGSNNQQPGNSQQAIGRNQEAFQVSQDPTQLQLQRQQQQLQQQMQQQQQPNTGQQGFSNWPQPNPSNPTTKQGKGKGKGEPGKRGRPRLNKSLSVPTNEFGEPIKKKRGRPKKNSDQTKQTQSTSNQGMQMSTTQSQQSFGNINNRRMSMPEPVTSNTGTHFMGSQKSFSELLEGDPVDFLAELNQDLEDGTFGNMFGNTSQDMCNPIGNQMNLAGFANNLNMPQSSQSFTTPPCSQQINTFDSTTPSSASFSDSSQAMPYQPMSLQSPQQHSSQQHYHPPHQQQQQQYHQGHHNQQPQQQECHQYMPSQSFTPRTSFTPDQPETSLTNVEDQSTELNLSQAMNISEPTVNFDTSLDNLFQKEESPELPEFPANTNIQSYNVHEHVITNPPTKRERSLSSGVIDRRRHSSSSKKVKLEDMSGLSASSSDLAAVMELIKYRQKSVQHPSPAYTFKFQIPTPIFKRLKFILRTNNIERNPREVVRMHPKDARKYSLLKIGREVVKLECLSQEKIDEIKERIVAGEEVTAIPPAIREVEIANIAVSNSIIAELLESADIPVGEEVNKMTEESGKGMEVLSTEPSENCQQIEGGEKTEAGEKVKRPRKNSMTKERKQGTMFKGNISSVPHLKKFRQGFQYFGKGHVGRGGHIRMRQLHPGLPQEFEDDGSIVLKDVSLTEASDGVLTPIKSRTPIAGRSPAYCSGNISEIESEKDLLESKLDVLKYELDLNQSGNSNTFQDAIFTEKDVEKVETDSAQETKEAKADSEGKTEEAVIIKSEVEEEIGTNSEKSKCEVDVEKQGLLEHVESEGTNVIVVEKQSDINENVEVVQATLETETVSVMNEKANSLKNGLTMAIESESVEIVVPNLRSIDKGRRSRSSSVESCSRSNSSTAMSRTNSMIGSGDDMAVEQSHVLNNVSKRRHKSENSDAGKRQKRVSSANSSTPAGSRKGSRSSSCETNGKKKSKFKKIKQRTYRYDSDSDGIPGVDYIVTRRFKGQKELRVVVDKLDEDSLGKYSEIAKKMNGFNSDGYENQVSSTESEVRNTCESEGDVKKETDRPFSGFSAEFEKFLAQAGSAPVVSDSDTEDCDITDIVKKKTQDVENEKCSIESEKKVNNDYGDKEGDYSRLKSEVDEKGDNCERDNDIKEIQKENLDVLNAVNNNAVSAVNEDGVLKKIEGVQCKTGECMCVDVCSSSCSCLPCFKNTNVNNSVSSLTGTHNFSSSSEDEDYVETKKVQRNMQNALNTRPKAETKKRKMPNKLHDGRAFCTKSRKKRQRAKPSKLMSTLSVLHDATMEKLTSAQLNSDMDTSSSNQSPSKYQSASDVDSPCKIRTKTPDFELYADKSDDHNTVYEDTMYKLAYLSPIPYDTSSIIPPQPLSPQEMTKLDGTTELVKAAAAKLNKETKLIKPDVIKSCENTRDSDIGSEKSNDAPSTPSKIAVAKTTTLTLQDIKTLCQAELDNELEEKSQSLVLGFTNTDSYTTVDQTSPDASICSNHSSSQHSAKKNLSLDFASVKNFFPTVDPGVDSTDSSPLVPVVSSKNFFPAFNHPLSSEIPLTTSAPLLTAHITKTTASTSDSASTLDTLPTDLRTSFPTLNPIECSKPSPQPLNLSMSASNELPLLDPYAIDTNEHSHIDSSSPPPDLGPPVCQSVPHERSEGFSPPPQLTPNRRISSNSDISLDEDPFSSAKSVQSMSRNSLENSTPPVLVPCRSPNTPTQGMKILGGSKKGDRISDMVDSGEFMTVTNASFNSSPNMSRGRIGRSPGGSITVIHSEEFSDISDENDDGQGHSDERSRSKKNFRRQSTGSFNMSGKFQNVEQDLYNKKADMDKEKKLREIKEFEKRLTKSERSENNIFELLSPRKESNANHFMQPMDYTGSPKVAQPIGNEKRQSLPYNFQLNGERTDRKFDLERLSGKLNPYNPVPERMLNGSQVGYGHVDTDSHPFSGFPVFNKGAHKNSEYQRSLSQNDVKVDYLMNGFSNSHIMSNGLSQGPVNLNKTFPIASREVNNDRYAGSSRNFFDNFNTNVFNGHPPQGSENSTGTSSDLFSSGIHASNHSNVPLYSRSLSESSRCEYSINHRSKLSESFVKNLKNCMSRDRPGDGLTQGMAADGPGMLEYGCGGGKTKHTATNNAQSQSRSLDTGSNRSFKSLGNNGGQQGHGFQGQGYPPQGQGSEVPYGCQVITPLSAPPTLESIQETALQHGLSTIRPLNVFYGNPKDVPEKARYIEIQ